MQEDSWAERIEWIVATFCSGNRSTLARKLGISTEAVSGLIKGSVPSGERLQDIITAYPRINPDWLLTGRGPKTRDYAPPATPTDAQRALERITAIVGALGINPDAQALSIAEEGHLAVDDAERHEATRPADTSPLPAEGHPKRGRAERDAGKGSN